MKNKRTRNKPRYTCVHKWEMGEGEEYMEKGEEEDEQEEEEQEEEEQEGGGGEEETKFFMYVSV